MSINSWSIWANCSDRQWCELDWDLVNPKWSEMSQILWTHLIQILITYPIWCDLVVLYYISYHGASIYPTVLFCSINLCIAAWWPYQKWWLLQKFGSCKLLVVGYWWLKFFLKLVSYIKFGWIITQTQVGEVGFFQVPGCLPGIVAVEIIISMQDIWLLWTTRLLKILQHIFQQISVHTSHLSTGMISRTTDLLTDINQTYQDINRINHDINHQLTSID
jgi:hypothetical protein